ncbi:MAG: hypothetical protein ACR2HY_00560 [Acidimicrobiales bacterium]
MEDLGGHHRADRRGTFQVFLDDTEQLCPPRVSGRQAGGDRFQPLDAIEQLPGLLCLDSNWRHAVLP